MSKRQWLFVAGVLMVAACGTGTEVCENPTVLAGQNHNRDEVGIVECSDPTLQPVKD
jgi:hypothetical protein